MAKEICISTTPHETRLAILEDDQLAEIYYERENEYTLAGSIYKGRVTRVLPGMQSSFVDVGLERDAFLYVTDFLEEQEDSEEYASEGGQREPRPRLEAGEEARSVSERNSGERNSGERGAERNGERHPERGRRPAVALSSTATQNEVLREPGREGGRAARERAREQAIAPLREAAPAAQDIEEKGDEESPAGTRRWRGRRGRRRGVRAGLSQAEVRPAFGVATRSEATNDVDDSHEPTEVTFAEHGAPDGTAVAAAAQTAAPVQPEKVQPRRNEGGRDRNARRSREPYALASTFDKPVAPSAAAQEWGERASSERESSFQAELRPPRVESSAHSEKLSAVSAIVLPGESLSKYGSAPAEATVVPETATVPKAAARAVNYVAPKPSTLVELSSGWDGGSVLPGETISRYRGSAAAVGSSSSSITGEPVGSDEPVAEPTALPMDQTGFSSKQEPGFSADAVLEIAEPVAVEVKAEDLEEGAAANGSSGGDGVGREESASRQAEEPVVAHELPPTVEPEIVAAAVSPEAEARAVHVAEPVLELSSEAVEVQGSREQGEVSVPTKPSEPAEYEPEHASASYRVGPVGASELRLASLEEEADSGVAAYTEELPAKEPHGADVSAGPVGSFADMEPGAFHSYGPELSSPAVTQEPQQEHGQVPEFAGEFAGQPELAHTPDEREKPEGEMAPAPDTMSEPASSWPHQAEQSGGLPILHQDGTVDLAAGHDAHAWLEPQEHFAIEDEPSHDSHDEAPSQARFGTEKHGHDLDEPDWRPLKHQPHEPEHAHPAATAQSALEPSEFSDLVDRLQGFAPGQGLLEEETLDEDEYDFEPLHAHAYVDESDQEELEEETLDQRMELSAIGDAVRESHLEQRVQIEEEAPDSTGPGGYPVLKAASLDFEVEEEEESLGYEEVEEGDDSFEQGEGEEPAHGAQPGEPQRANRGDEGRGRGRGRATGGRNGGRRNGPGRGRSAQTQDLPIISELLKQGQEILVQIAKEPIAKKGARITSHIALPGRFLVFMPTVSHVGVSRKIASDEERQRLKRILISEKGDSTGGFIVRTAAESATEEDLRADLRFLISLWTEIKQRSDTAKAPALIYHDLNLIERILRDQVSSNFSTIWVDSEAEYERIIRFLSRFQPQLVRRVKLYTKDTPLFEHFGIQEEISKALKSKVWLKSGGSIVINQTEALVAIDINTGKYVGKTSRLEDTIVKTNLDAIPEIVRQIRLRDLGGIIVIDFIDMDERKNRNKVLAALEEELKLDRAPSKVLQFNDFGLVAITRKRVKQSLERTLSVTCETCTGTGMVKSPITVCNEIYTEMRKMLKHLDGKDAMLRVHPEVVKQLKANNGKWINELEELAGKTIIIKSDVALHPEQFDIH